MIARPIDSLVPRYNYDSAVTVSEGEVSGGASVLITNAEKLRLNRRLRSVLRSRKWTDFLKFRTALLLL